MQQSFCHALYSGFDLDKKQMLALSFKYRLSKPKSFYHRIMESFGRDC